MFTTGNTHETAKALKEFCKEKVVYFGHAKDKSSALLDKAAAIKESKGIWLVEVAFARGYDIKFNKEAIVYIIDAKGNLKIDMAE